MAGTGKKHIVIDLVANDWLDPHPQKMLHPMKCKIIDAETGEQVGLVQKLELQFEVSSGGAWADGRVTGRMWKYDVTNPGTPDYKINFDEVTEYTVTVRRILEKSPPRGDEYEKYVPEDKYLAANRSRVLEFETGEQRKVVVMPETDKQRTARCEALLARRNAALKAAREAAREAGVTLEMEHEAFVADVVADAEKLAQEDAIKGVHKSFEESPLCQNNPDADANKLRDDGLREVFE